MSTRSEAEDVHQEGAHIAYVSHRLTVAATAYHDEPACHDLAQKLIYVPAITLAENHRRAHNHQGAPCRFLLLPLTMDLLRTKL